MYINDIATNSWKYILNVPPVINTNITTYKQEDVMNSNYPNRKSRNFRLSSYTITELQRLSEEYDTNMTAIVELAIAHFSQRRTSHEEF